eukprot:3649708-Prymnesium_polylepis.1
MASQSHRARPPRACPRGLRRAVLPSRSVCASAPSCSASARVTRVRRATGSHASSSRSGADKSRASSATPPPLAPHPPICGSSLPTLAAASPSPSSHLSTRSNGAGALPPAPPPPQAGSTGSESAVRLRPVRPSPTSRAHSRSTMRR